MLMRSEIDAKPAIVPLVREEVRTFVVFAAPPLLLARFVLICWRTLWTFLVQQTKLRLPDPSESATEIREIRANRDHETTPQNWARHIFHRARHISLSLSLSRHICLCLCLSLFVTEKWRFILGRSISGSCLRETRGSTRQTRILFFFLWGPQRETLCNLQ
jgi:hypothetical protein